MIKLQSYLSGQWVTGTGDGSALVNPTTEQTLAHASSEGLDLGAALAYGRETGGPALRFRLAQYLDYLPISRL